MNYSSQLCSTVGAGADAWVGLSDGPGQLAAKVHL